ncbi:MAG: Smr/MutS family protein [Flavobacteriales bacterium]|nr:Smr/MutS family protein [Flavobacteriales bacterium]
MIFPEDIEEKIGFSDIRSLILNGCRTINGKKLAKKMAFSNNFSVVQIWLKQVAEFKNLIENGSQPKLSATEIGTQIEKLSVKHSVLTVDDILEIRSLALDVVELIDFFQTTKLEVVELKKLIEGMQPPEELVQSINRVFDDFGNWHKNATPRLSELLDEIEVHQKVALSTVKRIYSQALAKLWVADTEVTIKNGRYVLPVFAEHKRKMNGIIHDESGGGKILYVEPIEVMEASNQLKELELERDREIHKILLALTKEIQFYLSDLKLFSTKIGIFDFIRSKAQLATKINATLPQLKSQTDCEIKDMYHPVLLLAHNAKNKETIPMSVGFSQNNRLIIVSGPNAGGKSVSIKTLALNQYMLQLGVLPSCSEQSVFGFFKNIMVDIGDNQSIDNDLSSYSSHLSAMKLFLEKGNNQSLIFIDEIGSGTDPNFGGAMAEAILIELNRKSVYGMVTTHFGNVKNLAEKQEGMENASMLYDTKNLKPLYQFMMGKPGSSFALEVAQNIGINKKIIDAARKRSNIKQQKTDELLATLEIERKELHEQKLLLDREIEYLSSVKEEYQSLKKSVESTKKDIIKEAQQKALQLLENANSNIESTIKTIVESNADKGKTKYAREGLERAKSGLKKELGLVSERPKMKEKPTLQVGSFVKIPNSNMTGEVVELRKNKAMVVAGIIKSSYNIADLVVLPKPKEKQKQKVSIGFVHRQQHFSMEKDVRGLRPEEAIKEIDQWIDDAIIIGIQNLRLIHGKGNGVLKKIIHDYYRGRNYIKRIVYEDVRLGGEGVSLIELN